MRCAHASAARLGVLFNKKSRSCDILLSTLSVGVYVWVVVGECVLTSCVCDWLSSSHSRWMDGSELLHDSCEERFLRQLLISRAGAGAGTDTSGLDCEHIVQLSGGYEIAERARVHGTRRQQRLLVLHAAHYVRHARAA